MYIPGAAGLCLPHDYSIESGRLTMFIIHYRLVQKNFTPVWISRLSCLPAWQTDQPMHSQSVNFGKFKLNSLNLAAFFRSTLYVSTSLPKVPILAHTIDSKLPQLFSHISRKSMLAGAYKSKIVRMHNVTKVSRGLVTVCEQIVYKLVSSPE